MNVYREFLYTKNQITKERPTISSLLPGSVTKDKIDLHLHHPNVTHNPNTQGRYHELDLKDHLHLDSDKKTHIRKSWLEH